MPIVDNSQAPEIPWRPGYRQKVLAGAEHGVSCSLGSSYVEPGAGAPYHVQDIDEVIVLLEGTLEFRLGDERHIISAEQTIVIPKGVAHGFTAVGPGPARILGFLPQLGGLMNARYLEGGPPAGASRR
jgi:quercetin dioxygenase-like cupin family protein